MPPHAEDGLTEERVVRLRHPGPHARRGSHHPHIRQHHVPRSLFVSAPHRTDQQDNTTNYMVAIFLGSGNSNDNKTNICIQLAISDIFRSMPNTSFRKLGMHARLYIENDSVLREADTYDALSFACFLLSAHAFLPAVIMNKWLEIVEVQFACPLAMVADSMESSWCWYFYVVPCASFPTFLTYRIFHWAII